MGISIILINLLLMYILALVFPPPKGTGFDGLDYALKPVFFSLIVTVIFIITALLRKNRYMHFYLLSLILCFGFALGLYTGLWS